MVGDGAHLQIDNVIRLTYYRRQTRPSIYGRDPSFIGPDEDAPIYWEPEFSLGQMYNKNIFLMGYVGEVCDFAECVLAGRPPERGGQAAFLEIMRWTEAVHQPAGTLTRIGRQA